LKKSTLSIKFWVPKVAVVNCSMLSAGWPGSKALTSAARFPAASFPMKLYQAEIESRVLQER
jgi:hypothetical protein